MKLIAIRPFPYASRRLVVGDAFETRGDSDGKLLIAIGHAKLDTSTGEPPQVPNAPPVPPRAAATVKTEPETDAKPELATGGIVETSGTHLVGEQVSAHPAPGHAVGALSTSSTPALVPGTGQAETGTDTKPADAEEKADTVTKPPAAKKTSRQASKSTGA